MFARRILLVVAAISAGSLAALANVIPERLLELARKEAPGEVQLHVIKTTGRMTDFAAKVRSVEQVPGWSQIRAKGEAAFSAWDNHKRDFVWRSEAFEVLWDVTDRGELKLNEVSLGGVSRKADN